MPRPTAPRRTDVTRRRLQAQRRDQPPARRRDLLPAGHRAGARLPHHWLPDGSSLYHRLGRGFTLVRPALDGHPGVAVLARTARRRGTPLALVESSLAYPWARAFSLVRPDQHIAWRASDPVGPDIEAAAGLRAVE